MSSLEKLWDAMAELANLQVQHDKERDEYDGYSWDWSGYWYNKLKEARKAATQCMNKAVDERIVAKLKEVKHVG